MSKSKTKKKSTAPKPRQPSQADILRLGAGVASVKAQTNPKAWASFVKNAHARGWTVAGALSDAPDSLKERTQASLKTQATKSVTEAYAPVKAELDQQEARIKAWDAKRAQDNASYNSWLQAQNATLASQAAANSATLATQNAAIVKAQADAAIAAQQHAGDNFITAQTAANADKNTQLVNAAGTAAQGVQSAAAAAAPYAQGQQLAEAAARDAQRYADTSKALSGLVSARSQTAIKQASDTLSEFTRLQSQNAANQDSNRNYAAAAAKLDIAGQTLELNKTKAANSYALGTRAADTAAKNAETNAKRLAETKRHNQRVEANAAQARADLKKYRDAQLRKPSAKGAAKITAAERRLSAQVVQQVDSARQDIADYLKGKPGGNVRKHLRNAGYSSTVIEVAIALRASGGKLTGAALQKAKALGILNAEGLYG